MYAQYDERHDKELFFDVYQDTEKTYCSQRIMPPFPGMAPIAGWRHNGRAGRWNREQITVEQKFISGFQRSRTPPEAGTGEGPGGKGICLDAKYLLQQLAEGLMPVPADTRSTMEHTSDTIPSISFGSSASSVSSSSCWSSSFRSMLTTTGRSNLMSPIWLVGFILGTTNPLTIGISAENQWVCLFSCQS